MTGYEEAAGMADGYHGVYEELSRQNQRGSPTTTTSYCLTSTSGDMSHTKRLQQDFFLNQFFYVG